MKREFWQQRGERRKKTAVNTSNLRLYRNIWAPPEQQTPFAAAPTVSITNIVTLLVPISSVFISSAYSSPKTPKFASARFNSVADTTSYEPLPECAYLSIDVDPLTQAKYPSEASGPRTDPIVEIPNHLYNKSSVQRIDTSCLCVSTYRFVLQLKVLERRLNESQKFVIAAIDFPVEIIEDFFKQIGNLTPTFHDLKTHIRSFWAVPQPSVYSLDNVPPATSHGICSLIRLTANELSCGQDEQSKTGAIRKAPLQVRGELLALTYLPLSSFKQAVQAILGRQSSQKYSLYSINQTTNINRGQRFQSRQGDHQYQSNRPRGDF